MLGTLASSADASSFTPGNVVVVRVGTGAAPLSNASTAVFLEEYSPAGALVQTIPLPTAASGLQFPLTNSGSATSEGFLTLSTDGRYLVQAGYGAAPGITGIVSTTSASTPRVVARIDLAGIIDTSTALGDAYSGNNIRSATTDDGSRFWTGGTATAGGGVRFATFGGTTTTQISTTITNTRVVNISGGQLYVSSATGAFQGVSTVGTGLPTASGETITLLPGFPAAAGSYDYYFSDASTLYVADDRSTGSGGGLQKWTFNGTTWSLAYTLNSGLTAGLRGVSAVPNSSPLQLFATSADSLSKLVTVTDSGAASAFTTLVTAGTNTALRGVRYLPAGVGCTAPGVTTDPLGASVCPGGSASFSIAASGTDPLSYSWELNGTPVVDGGGISGQGTTMLSIAPVTAADAGSYVCVVTNSCGSATSSAAILDVLTLDTDGDGTADCNDGCPGDPLKIAPGICGCGVADTDTDGDGTLDCLDGCPSDPLKTEPGICGCGVVDTDTDGDGTADCNDGCPSDPLKTEPGICGCGTVDTDADGDGTADCNDGCPSDPLKVEPGQCGCGVVDTDTDGDGTADCNDGCPSDPAKIDPGQCGCGVAELDTDGDSISDCIDNCVSVPNVSQSDVDSDGVGDFCDNCIALPNPGQEDCDGNALGDVCDIQNGAPDCNLNGVPDTCDLSGGSSQDLNGNLVLDECEVNGGTPYCFGYTGCPCGNDALIGSGEGCTNSTDSGAKLVGSGLTSLSADGLSLNVTNLPIPPLPGGTNFVQFFQGTTQVSTPFQDGRMCAGGSIIRLGTLPHMTGSASYPAIGDPSVSVKGLVAGPGVRNYQAWYRNALGPCGTGSNFSNGLSVIWTP